MPACNRPLTFKRGNTVAQLRQTQVEIDCVWRSRLALLNDDGEWMYSEHWPTNALRKATREILSLGYALVESK